MSWFGPFGMLLRTHCCEMHLSDITF